MEPCGCAGLDRMKGGMTRRHTLFKTLREDGWPVVGLDVGGIAKGFSPQALAKFQFMVEGMRKMGYDAITLGKADLQLPAEELLALTAPVNNQPSPFVMANVALFGFDAKAVAPLRVIEAGGRRVGITGVLGKQFQKQIHGKELEMIAPEAALAKIVPELKRQADYLVLLAHATREESLELARKFPDFDLVVTAGGGEEPPAEDARIPGSKARLIEVGTKGMNAIVVGLFNDPKKPMRYQRVPLDSRFPASPDMKALMAAYQDQIKAAGFEKLGAREVPHPQAATMGRFVGSEKCAQCHEESYAVWKKSGHSRAFKTLEQADPPRQYDPECVSCHVVGWHPTQFFPYRNGYVSREKTPKLVNVGCENCHGPGEDHVKAEGGSNQAWRDKARKATVITKAEAADPTSKKMNCWSCHDLDNSPAFHFDTYWPKIEHREKDSDGEATP
jgi:hypothetical protein